MPADPLAGGEEIAGLLLVDKPVGISSHTAVAAVRRAFGNLKAGHAGTLDPFASGLLIVLLGKGTKIQDRVMGLAKSYETVALLGARSSTGDPEGEITITGLLPPDPPALPQGEIRQRPPMHSAIKVAGERAYRRARRGESFQMPERFVTLYGFRESWREPVKDGVARAGYEIECSSGTYVRSLIAELGDGYCLELRRTAIGPFSIEDAVGLPPRSDPANPETARAWREQLPDSALLAVADALALIPARAG